MKNVPLNRNELKDRIFHLMNKVSSSLKGDVNVDDFLDKTGSKKLVGKPVKKDNKKGKSTLLKLIGEEKAQNYGNYLKRKILRKLEKHGKKAEELRRTIKFILERKF